MVESWEMLSQCCEPGSDRGYTSSVLSEFDFGSGSVILSQRFNLPHRNELRCY